MSKSIEEKLRILSDAAKYDVSCSSSGSSRKNTNNGLGNAAINGICHSWSADGRCISLLKILMTNYCMYDCKYCINRKGNDIERATAIAKSMITKYGMNARLGTVTYGSESQEVFLGRDLAQEKTYSEETAAIIDEEIKKMISKSYQRAKELLEQNMDKLDAVATVLIEKEKITEEEFNQVFDQN